MDFVRLGPAYSTAYFPDTLIEGYNSLVWTERFQDHGEFELKSFKVPELLALLPVDTLVSHLDTREVMIVETVSIEWVGEGEDAQPEITIGGRSVSFILEHRWVESTYQYKRAMRQKYSATSALCVLLYNALDNTSGKDVTRGDTAASTPEGNDYAWPTQEAIPNVAITETVAAEGSVRNWYLEQGVLYPQLQQMLLDSNLGIRAIRPVSPTPGTVISVSSTLSSRGTITRTAVSDIPQLQYNVYAGTDRSATVQLSQLQGHVDKPSYLDSMKEQKTQVELVTGGLEVGDVYISPEEKNFTGWKRRTMGFDGGTAEIPAAPKRPASLKSNATAAQKKARAKAMDNWIDDYARWKNKRANIITDFRESQTAAALLELKKNRRINMFSGEFSDLAPFKYGTHYFLGDTVQLFGDYGRSSKMIVSEYIRTENSDGDRGYPGLVEP